MGKPIKASLTSIQSHPAPQSRRTDRSKTRRDANRALRASEKRYRALYNTLIEGYCLIEVLFDARRQPVDYRFLEVNPAFERQTGLRNAQGKRMRELAPNLEAHWFEIYGKVALTGQSIRFESEAHALHRFYEVHAYRVGGARSRRVAVLFNDITERKRAEQEVLASETRYRQFIHALPVAVYACDAHGRITLYNDATVTLWGRKPNLSRDRWSGAYRLFTADGRRLRRFHAPIALAVKNNQPIRGAEVIVVRSDGSRSHVLAFPQPILDAAGRVQGAITIQVDVTVLKLTENSLRASEQKLRTLSRVVEQSPASVVITNLAGTIEYVNTKFTEVTGYSLAEVKGQNPRILKSGHQPAEYYRQMWETIAAGREWRGEFCNRKKNGEHFWEFAVITPVHDEHGVVTHFAAIKEDITDRKRLEHEILEISEREQSRIGHDLHDGLCQHLAGIEFRLMSLKQQLTVKSPRLAAEANQLGKLIRDGVEQTRTLARGLSPVMLAADGLMNALQELASLTKKMFRLNCEFYCPAPVLIHDNAVATHLYRIAQEAVHNAVRHGKAKSVQIRLALQNNRITLGVKDDGIGIPSLLAPHKGMGLHVMHYRAGMVNGSLVVQREPAGGTAVVCSLRVPGQAAAV